MDVPEGWTLEDGGKALAPDFKFKDFSEAFGFLPASRLHAEKVDHHPEFTSVWNRVDFRLTSHDAGGVTDRDVKLARRHQSAAGRHREAVNSLAAYSCSTLVQMLARPLHALPLHRPARP